jgi:hypothetical protein
MVKHSVLLILLGVFQISFARNPILPPIAFIPDGEPDVFEYKGEKRVFLYGSRDERVTAFCGYGHDLWSAPVTDLTEWTFHGEIFHVSQVQAIGYGRVDPQIFGAPDCVYNPVAKKYYLYTFMGRPYAMDGIQGPLPGSDNYVPGFGDFGPKCVVASSVSPTGPFINPMICDWPAENKDGTFDPAVLVDPQPDGSVKVYVYWGMRKGDRWAQVDPLDMHTIIDPKTGKPDRNAWSKILDPEQKRTLFEASSIRKVAEDKYVFICSTNETISALTYFYSNSPEGPWVYGGEIVNNKKNWKGGNNHGGIENINGQWYIFYHRQTTNSYNRQAMAEPISLTIEGNKVIIPPIEMTSQGTQSEGLDPFSRYNANVICYVTFPFPYIDGSQRNPDGLNPMVGITAGSVLGVKYFNFGKSALTNPTQLTLKLNIKALQSDVSLAIQVARPQHANNKSKRVTLASFELNEHLGADGSFHEVSLPLNHLDQSKLDAFGELKGKVALFFEFKGWSGNLCELKEFELTKL